MATSIPNVAEREWYLHPGVRLREEFLPPLGLPVTRLAEHLGVTPGVVRRLLTERRDIGVAPARRLGDHFKISVELWLNLQCAFAQDFARITGHGHQHRLLAEATDAFKLGPATDSRPRPPKPAKHCPTPMTQVLPLDKGSVSATDCMTANPSGIATANLQLWTAGVDGLQPRVEAILCASDLQDRESGDRPGCLFGMGAAGWIASLQREGRLPSPDRCGVILAGNLYSDPALTYRDVPGDVRPVWELSSLSPGGW